MQFQSDILQVPVSRPKVTETTALGAAYPGRTGPSGYWKDVDEIRKQWQEDRKFSPEMEDAKVAELTRGWEAGHQGRSGLGRR